jgi:hypothetical protein
LKGFAFRETCYRCPYANLDRLGDFTVGDCDSRADYPQFHPDMSNSTLLLNTAAAKKVWESGLSEYFDSSDLDIANEQAHNKQLKAPFPRQPERDAIYFDCDAMRYSQLQRKYANPYDLKSRVKTLLIRLLPQAVIRKIRVLIKK